MWSMNAVNTMSMVKCKADAKQTDKREEFSSFQYRDGDFTK
jgi:hypothetical protein